MKDDRKLLRELSMLFNVNEKDLPRTLQRFKEDVEEMEKQLAK